MSVNNPQAIEINMAAINQAAKAGSAEAVLQALREEAAKFGDAAMTGTEYIASAIRWQTGHQGSGYPMCDLKALVADADNQPNDMRLRFASIGYDALMQIPDYANQTAPLRGAAQYHRPARNLDYERLVREGKITPAPVPAG